MRDSEKLGSWHFLDASHCEALLSPSRPSSFDLAYTLFVIVS
ncbi:hypothetical protein ACHAXR_002276 [Thalassiosira sp. AJA248-18]